MADKKTVPTGVKVIAVLYYIGAVLGLIISLLWLFAAKSIGAKMQTPFGAIGSSLMVLGGIMFIGFGIISFFLGRGLWNAKSWARIVVIIFAGLGALISLTGMAFGEITVNIPNLAIQLVIGGYLLFDNSVKKAFV